MIARRVSSKLLKVEGVSWSYEGANGNYVLEQVLQASIRAGNTQKSRIEGSERSKDYQE